MSIIALPVTKSEFVSRGAEHFLFTASQPGWIKQACLLLGVESIAYRVGQFMISALNFSDKTGFLKPSEAEVNSSLVTFGVNPRSEKDLARLAKGLVHDNTKVVLEFPKKIYHYREGKLYLFNHEASKAIDISYQPAPALAIAGPDILKPIKDLMMEPVSSFREFQVRFSSGTCRLITQDLVSELAQEFFKSFPSIQEFAGSHFNVCVHRFTNDQQIVLKKFPEGIKAFALFDQFCWQGSYKTVFLSVELFDRMKPCGVSMTSDLKEGTQELAMRSIEALSPLLTPVYFHWTSDKHMNLVHGWATKGSLEDTLAQPLTLEDRDKLALQLLEKMHIFHQHAVHKDLNAKNLLVDRSEGVLNLYINDVGMSCTRANEEDIKEVATNSYNLAPEVIRKCIPISGYFWNDAFDAPITFDEWISSEKYLIAQLIYQIYTGKSLFGTIHDTKALLAPYPYAGMEFSKIQGDFKKLYKLDDFILESLKAEHKEIYSKAFHQFYIGSYRQELLDLKGPGAKADAEEDPAALFEPFFSDHISRTRLEVFIDGAQRSRLIDIYKNAFRRMNREATHVHYGDLARLISDQSVPIGERIPDLKHVAGGRMEVILPLLDLDPLRRPSLMEIKEALQAKIG